MRPSHAEGWLSAQGGERSASSLNSFIEVLRAVFALTVRNRLLAESPAAGLRYQKRKKPIRKTPTVEEFRAVVADIRAQVYNTDSQDSVDFVEFIGLAGLGQTEASSLTWDDVDWRNEQIATLRRKTKRGFLVPIYPQLRPLLERLREGQGSNPPGDAKVLKLKDAKKAIAGACKRLGLPAYNHRSFRRMFITRAIQRGVDVKVVADLASALFVPESELLQSTKRSRSQRHLLPRWQVYHVPFPAGPIHAPHPAIGQHGEFAMLPNRWPSHGKDADISSARRFKASAQKVDGRWTDFGDAGLVMAASRGQTALRTWAFRR